VSASALPEGVTLRGLGQHRLKDLGQPERIHQLEHPELPSDFPPLKSVSAVLNNLPFQVTSFIGRERELSELTTLVHTTRLLTLTGTGGAGKTRLALHVAADVIDNFDDGVWFVEVSRLTEGQHVPQALATALNLHEEPGRILLDTALDMLRPRRALLIFDNCEHLVVPCGQLADLILRTCPHLHIVATSREPLGIVGETAWRVPSLSLPVSLGPVPSLPEAQRSEAVRLFQERAAAAQPGFMLNERNIAVSRRCSASRHDASISCQNCGYATAAFARPRTAFWVTCVALLRCLLMVDAAG
jgi:hypothetical protein